MKSSHFICHVTAMGPNKFSECCGHLHNMDYLYQIPNYLTPHILHQPQFLFCPSATTALPYPSLDFCHRFPRSSSHAV